MDLLEVPSTTTRTISDHTQFNFLQGDFTHMNMKECVVDSIYNLYQQKEKSKHFSTDISEKYIQEIYDFLHQNDELTKERRYLLATQWYKTIFCRADVVISDMAANFTGDQSTDALRTMSLCEDALIFAIGSSCFHNSGMDDNHPIMPPCSWNDFGLLRIGGTFLCKFFSCGDENEKDLKEALSNHFERINVMKPHASRKESAEQYIMGSGFKGSILLQEVISKLKLK